MGLGTEEKIVNHLLCNLEPFSFPLPYIRKHLIGIAMDGQYTCMDVNEHMQGILQNEINLSWEPMHRIELASNATNQVLAGWL